MSVRCRRRVALLAYALASTFSDLWHTHREPLLVEHIHRPTLAEFDVTDFDLTDWAGHHHGHAPTSHVADLNGGSGHPSDHDDSCAACRFVAQSSLPSLPVAEPPLGELTNDLRVVAPITDSSSVPSDCLARAPPAAG